MNDMYIVVFLAFLLMFESGGNTCQEQGGVEGREREAGDPLAIPSPEFFRVHFGFRFQVPRLASN